MAAIGADATAAMALPSPKGSKKLRISLPTKDADDAMLSPTARRPEDSLRVFPLPHDTAPTASSKALMHAIIATEFIAVLQYLKGDVISFYVFHPTTKALFSLSFHISSSSSFFS